MRTLLLMRGAPGSGKSTFIQNNNLTKYTLSADEIRLLIQTPVQNVDGNFEISQNNEKKVWQILFDILEERMKRGEFTVIDATNSKTSEMNRYKDLAKAYRYRVYLVDFTDLPIEICKQRNGSRPEYKRVPEEVIDKMYSRFEGQNVPREITVIKPDELDKILIQPLDVSKYERIFYIGDIHGCYTTLKEFIDSIGGIKDENCYVFTGDYIDRGYENAEVLKYLYSICEKPNVWLLEGNHDREIYDYAHDLKTNKKQFDDITAYELKNKKVDKKEMRILYRNIGQCAFYKYHEKTILATHGGISKISENLLYLATSQMIHGVGKYSEMETVCENFEKNNPKVIQVFGHRNVEDKPICLGNCFNLEGAVEFGGYLRSIEFYYNPDTNEVESIPHYTKNTYEKQETLTEEEKTELDIDELIDNMKNSPLISESKFDNISSFNFTRAAFRKGVWDGVTNKARGLFINTNTKQIVARSYNKFFNINETEETQLIFIKSKFNYPLSIYKKYNGFLGLIGYDEELDQLIITSKSSLDGDHVGYFRKILEDNQNIDLDQVKEFVKKNPRCTLVFEVIDPVNDPHIIEYKEPEVILLDVIYNTIKFDKMPYEDVCYVGKLLGFKVKELCFTINSTEEFFNWYYEVKEEDYKFKEKYIEGFVIEDKQGFMCKLKCDYYNTWKYCRTILNTTKKQGYIVKNSSLSNKLFNDFYNWCKENRDNLPEDIITARKMFLERGEDNE